MDGAAQVRGVCVSRVASASAAPKDDLKGHSSYVSIPSLDIMNVSQLIGLIGSPPLLYMLQTMSTKMLLDARMHFY